MNKFFRDEGTPAPSGGGGGGNPKGITLSHVEYQKLLAEATKADSYRADLEAAAIRISELTGEVQKYTESVAGLGTSLKNYEDYFQSETADMLKDLDPDTAKAITEIVGGQTGLSGYNSTKKAVSILAQQNKTPDVKPPLDKTPIVTPPTDQGKKKPESLTIADIRNTSFTDILRGMKGVPDPDPK